MQNGIHFFDPNGSISDLTRDALILLVVVLVYFIPASVAVLRRHPNRVALFAANVIFGWTFIGWGLCLVWSLLTSNRSKPMS